MKKKTLCVVMPVFNEKATIEEIIKRVKAVKLDGIEKKLIIIDDCSTDGTREILKKVCAGQKWIKLILKEKNAGKGAALRDGFAQVKGDFVIIQDADLEYDPEDYRIMLATFRHSEVDVVYGSRFLGPHRAFMFMNYMANKALNLMTNMLYNTILTDMETCYKMFRADVIKSIEIKSRGFEIEPEITAKLLKKNFRIYEVPISYFGRSVAEGKKIKSSDGFKAVWALIKYRFTD